MIPFSSGTSLREMIQSIRACKTAAEERAVVRKECAAIRELINENEPDYRHRNLAKLMFIHMLGYPTHFGQMECLKLITSSGFPEKRIGYLGLTLSIDERHEVLMLVTNSLKQDLNHSNPFIVGLALCAMGNICSAEMARDLAPEVERLLQIRDPHLKKKVNKHRLYIRSITLTTFIYSWNVELPLFTKAALCSIRIIKKVPDLVENFLNPAASLLREKHHGGLIAGVQLCTDLCKVNPEALEYFRKQCTDISVKVLKDAVNSPYAPEYDISGILDPFLHIRLLKFLRTLGQGDADASDCMNNILVQVATKTETNRNAGNAILLQCLHAIMGIEDNSGLRVLAINILGRFLSNRDNNIRYVALDQLLKFITIDAQAVQRHRSTIMECVKDPDISIRKRALELVYLLVNESNVKASTKDLIEFLQICDHELKGDLTVKLSSIIEKFSFEKLLYVDQMVKVLVEAGNFVKDEVWRALIVIVSNASYLHGYTVRTLYRALQTSVKQATLVRVAVWCIGEYADLLVNNIGMLDIEEPITVTEHDAVDEIEKASKDHHCDATTNAMALITLLKLSARFPSCSQRIRDIIIRLRGSVLLELQQRAIEFDSIIEKHHNIRSTLLERIPVLDEAAYIEKRAGSLPSSISILNRTPTKPPNGVAILGVGPLVDLLDLCSDDTQQPASSGKDFLQDLLGVDLASSSSQSGTSPVANVGTDVLMDLLSIGESSRPKSSSLATDTSTSSKYKRSPLETLDTLPSPSLISIETCPISSSAPTNDLLGAVSRTPPKSGENHPDSSIVAYESSTLKIIFKLSKCQENPQITMIKATFVNMSTDTYTDFIFQAAVPKFLQLHLEPASSSTLPANGVGSITQNMRITNSQHQKKAIMLRIRIAYKSNIEDRLEEGQVNNITRNA